MTAMLEAIAIERACKKVVIEIAARVDAQDFAGLGELFAERRGRLLMHS